MSESYLLDTHTLLWLLSDSDQLSKKVRAIIENRNNAIYVSMATFWELAIKINLGKLTLNTTLSKLIPLLTDNGH
ncbi:MAG: type II toxin-antitoxin system VapC family toxin [Bacteroidota bacterium]